MKTKHRQQGIVHQAVRHALKKLEDLDGTLSTADGESYVCGFCMQPVKPCESDAHYVCKDKMLGETELHRLVTRVHEVSNGRPVACSLCGKMLAAREMCIDALRELCPACQAKSAWSKRGMK